MYLGAQHPSRAWSWGLNWGWLNLSKGAMEEEDTCVLFVKISRTEISCFLLGDFCLALCVRVCKYLQKFIHELILFQPAGKVAYQH